MKLKSFLSANPLSSDAGLLILRLLAGGTMLTHGFPKFLKLLSGNLEFADPLGMGPEVSFILVVFAEFICSLLIIFGLTTRLALVPIFITMAVGCFVVHAGDDFGAKELPFLYMGMYIVLFFTGPGKYSIDAQVMDKHQPLPKAA